MDDEQARYYQDQQNWENQWRQRYGTGNQGQAPAQPVAQNPYSLPRSGAAVVGSNQAHMATPGLHGHLHTSPEQANPNPQQFFQISSGQQSPPLPGPQQEPHCQHECVPGTQTQPLLTASTYQAGNPPNAQNGLNQHFQMRPTSFFQVGKIIGIPWSEQEGNNCSGDHSSCTMSIFRQHVYHKIMRAVVVKDGGRSCLCVPINTYRDFGATKHGLDLSTHAPILKQGENRLPLAHRPNRGLIDTVFHMVPANPRERMLNTSLINFGDVHTVQYNWPIRYYGYVDDVEELRFQYNTLTRSLPPN